MTIWAPVIAALGASLLTGVFTWGASWWVERRRDRTTDAREKDLAYHQFISRPLTFSGRVGALRNTMETAVKEGDKASATLGRPFGAIDVFEWLEKDLIPINDAWSKIQMIGSPEAVDESTQLLDACGDLLGLATSLGDAQQQALDAAGSRLIEAREVFIRVARKELGKEPTLTPGEERQQQAVASGGNRELAPKA